MSRQDDLKKLILYHERRLQKLREQQALKGISTDPKIFIEIEDIEATIAALQAELALEENNLLPELSGSLSVPAKVAAPQSSPVTLSERSNKTPQPTLAFRFHTADGERYQLMLRGAAAGELPGSFTSPYDPLTWQAVMLALEPNFQWAEAAPEMQAVLQPLGDLARLPEAVGAALAEALLADETIRREFDAALKRAEQSRQPLPIELRFDSGCEILTALPWELLYYNDRFLMADASITLSRCPEGAGLPTLALAELPLRVLLVLAEPVDASPVFPERAREELLHGLRSLDEEGGVIVDLLRPPTFETLIEAASNGGYHVLVFYGHGGYDEASGGLLLFEDEFGGPALIPASDLSAALRNTEVLLVLLGACQSARVPDLTGFPNLSGLTIWHGVAPALLRAGVPLAIGMQVSMRVDAALAFIRQFALSLAAGKPVGEAVGDARKPLIQRKYGRAWFIPALYGRSDDGDRLFDPAHCLPAGMADLRASLKAQRAEIAQMEQAIGGVGMLRQPGEIARLRAAKSDFARTRAELARHAPGGYTPVTSPLYGVPSNPVFVGRAAELQQVSQKFSSGRPVVVWGAGGLGKTALAIEVAHRQGWRFPGGVLWLDCRGGPALDTLLDQIGAFCGLEAMEQVKPEQKETTVRWKLAELSERCLLIWDNAEEVWDNAGVRRFIDSLPTNAQILITTRENPKQLMWPTEKLEPLKNEAMTDLFYRLATTAGVKIGTQADLEAIPPMLRWLQGHPLALILIVDQILWRGVKRVWADLQKEPLPGIDAAFNLSYKRLTKAQRRLFTRLSVFTIPFEWEAAKAILPDQKKVDDLLDVLVQRALLTFDGARYAYHALLRQYAYAKLREMEDSRPVHKLAAEYLQSLAEQRPRTSEEGLEEVDQWEKAEVWENFAHSARTLVGTLDKLGYWGEIQERLERASTSVKIHLGSLPDLAAGLLRTRAALNNRKGNWDEAITLDKEAANLYQTVGDVHNLARTYISLGNDYQSKANWKWAIKFYQHSLDIMEKLGDQFGLAQIYMNLGAIYLDTGEWKRAIEFFEKSSKIMERLEDNHSLAQIYMNLGNVYQKKEDWERAIKFYQQSTDIMERLEDRYRLAQIYANLGILYRRIGKWGQAIEFYQKSLVINEELGDKPGVARTYMNLGNVYQEKEDWERAIELYQQSLTIQEGLKDSQGLSQTYMNLGTVYRQKGELRQSVEFYQRSKELLERLEDRYGLALIWVNLGGLYLETDRIEEAKPLLAHAFLVLTKLGSPDANIAIGGLLKACGSLEIAQAYLRAQMGSGPGIDAHPGRGAQP